MKVMAYIPLGCDPENIFLNLFNELIPHRHAQIYTRFEDLSKGLKRPTTNVILAIFMIKDIDELQGVLSMESYFSGLHIILILPDLDKKTLDKAYKLFPRYISDTKDYDDLSLVIKKMTKNRF